MATSEANGKKRPRLVLLSEETRRRSALLAQELSRWPGVSMRPMFGLHAFYRGTVVFAMLPDKRALESAKAIAYKLPKEAPGKEGGKWKLFELENDSDIDRALVTLDKAYRKAGAPDRKK
jgi:hypothetical protein